GDTLWSDTYMLLNSVDIKKSGKRLWINRKQATLEKLKNLQQEMVKQQKIAGQDADADHHWLIVNQQEIM
ncbi:haloacid dehalogenase-like hydrolase, partial [Enterobacteriaceae bacterium LUAb1]